MTPAPEIGHCAFVRFRQQRPRRGGAILVIALLGMVLLASMVFFVFNVGHHVSLRVEAQNAADNAAISGAGEIALAITMSTLTTVIVFLPVALVEGPAQFFLTRMAIPISVALVASLFESRPPDRSELERLRELVSTLEAQAEEETP